MNVQESMRNRALRGSSTSFDISKELKKRNEDLSGAQLINENHNVVRIMTIHKSKGLEFPVVFIMRTTKNMLAAKPTEEHRIQLHKDLGIGIDYINYENLYLKS